MVVASPRSSNRDLAGGGRTGDSWEHPLPPTERNPFAIPTSSVEALLTEAAQLHAQQVGALQVTIYKLKAALSEAKAAHAEAERGSEISDRGSVLPKASALMRKEQPEIVDTTVVKEQTKSNPELAASKSVPDPEASHTFSEDSTDTPGADKPDQAAAQLPGVPDGEVPLPDASPLAPAGTPPLLPPATPMAAEPQVAGETSNVQSPTQQDIATMEVPVMLPVPSAGSAAKGAVVRNSSRRSLQFEEEYVPTAPTLRTSRRDCSHSPSNSFLDVDSPSGGGRMLSKGRSNGRLRGSTETMGEARRGSLDVDFSPGGRRRDRDDDDAGLPRRRVSDDERSRRRSTQSFHEDQRSFSKGSASECSFYDEPHHYHLNKSATAASMFNGHDVEGGFHQIRKEWQQGQGMLRSRSVHANRNAQAWTSNKLQGAAATHEQQQVIQYNGFMGRLILKPDRTERIGWELIGSFFIAYDLIVVPLTLVFQPPEGWFVFSMDWMSLIFWTLNIPASFLVGVVKDGVLIMVPSKIAKNYAKSWLLIDLLVVVPDWFFTALRQYQGETNETDGEYVKLLRMMRLTRTLRLLRLLKLKWILEVLNDMLETEYMSIVAVIVKKLFMLVFICHYIACTWFLIADIRGSEDTWIKVHEFQHSDWFYQYVTSFHWALTQFTPASMDVNPQNIYERTFNVFIVVFALVGFSYVVGSISASLGQLRALKEDVEKQFWSVRKYMRQNAVPKHLSIRIVRYLEKENDRQKTRMSASSIKIFGLLSEQLLSEMQCAVCLPNLELHPLFDFLTKTAGVMMQRLALKGISQKLLAVEDTLFVPDDKAGHMGVILFGCLRYSKILKNGGSHEELVDKGEDWVAEQALWCENWKYVGECVAVTDVELQNVDIQTFIELACSFPTTRLLISSYARSYMRLLWEMDDDDLLDISKVQDVCYIARDCINDYNFEFGEQNEQAEDSEQVEKKDKFNVLRKVRALSTGRLEAWYTHTYASRH